LLAARLIARRVRCATATPQSQDGRATLSGIDSPTSRIDRGLVPEAIQVGYQTFVADGGEEFGAIREVRRDGVVVYVENAGDFYVPLEAVDAVHAQKVVFRCDRLGPRLRQAIGHAHDAEEPGL
jgi:hypothetical protein